MKQCTLGLAYEIVTVHATKPAEIKYRDLNYFSLFFVGTNRQLPKAGE
jgi:hypothetical protein